MLKKSFFTKLLTLYTGVLILILFIISSLLRFSFQRIYYNDEFRRLENNAVEIAEIYNQFIIGNLSSIEFQVGVRTFSRATNALVLIATPDGRIVFNSAPLMGGTRQHMTQRNTIDDSILPHFHRALDGNVVREVLSSTLHNESSLNLLIPIFEFENVVGAMIISQPVQDITPIITRVNKLIWIVGVFGSFLAIIVLWVVSKNFTKPIVKLNNAALSMASSKFQKVEVKTQDEIGQLSHSFNYMGEQLAKQEENRREFLTTVSHELRTPLTSTLGFIQGMLDGVIERDSQEHYLKITVNEIKRMISLTNDLLDLEKIKQGQINLHKDYFDISNLIQECLSHLEPLYKNKNITCNFEPLDDIVLLGDRNRIKQVFVNLLDNSIRHANSKIDIRLSTTPNKIIIEVHDDGNGIAPEEVPHIFERFYKVDKSRTYKGSGAGLGLAIAKNLVDLHDGSLVFVPSEVGAKFKVTLSN